jgi:hypothetical protein
MKTIFFLLIYLFLPILCFREAAQSYDRTAKTPKNQMKTIFFVYLPLLVCKNIFKTRKFAEVTPLNLILSVIYTPINK